MADPVLVSYDSGILNLTLNRPEALNAMSREMAEIIMQAINETKDVNLCVIQGVGKSFCAGFDLSDMSDLSDGDLLYRFLRIEMMLQTVHYAPFPTLALAKGYTIGAGADLFAACSYRVADPSFKMKMPGWNFGLALGTRRLKELVGTQMARDILIDTRTVAAAEALEIGLCSELADEDQWDGKIDQHAARCEKLSHVDRAQMLSLTAKHTQGEDLAAVIRTAGRPGLRQRIIDYQEQVKREREARRKSSA